jgi:putative ABC transport system permease protein
MSTAKRAFLYITRKRGRNLLFFVIICAMSVFAMLGLVISSSARSASAALRKSLNSSFTLEVYEAESERESVVDQFGNPRSFYAGPMIDMELLDQIMEIEAVTNYYIQREAPIWTVLSLRPGMYNLIWQAYITGEGIKIDDKVTLTYDDGLPADWEMRTQSTYMTGCSDSMLHEFFRMGALELAEGRHIGPDDRNKALISTWLAEENGLTVGDTFSVEIRESHYKQGDAEKVIGDPMEFEIAGLFDANFERETSFLTMEQSYAENVIYCDLSAMAQISESIHTLTGFPAELSRRYRTATIYVDDPDHVEATIERVKELAPPDYFEIKADDTAYRASARPLGQLETFSIILISVAALGCIILLILTLNMWTKSRKREIGVLLSIGVRKRGVVLQLLLENTVIAVAALIIAALISGALAGGVGELADRIVSPPEGAETYYVDEGAIHLEVEKRSADPVNLEYGLSAGTAAIVAAAVLCSTAFGVLVASRDVIDMEPRKILSGL